MWRTRENAFGLLSDSRDLRLGVPRKVERDDRQSTSGGDIGGKGVDAEPDQRLGKPSLAPAYVKQSGNASLAAKGAEELREDADVETGVRSSTIPVGIVIHRSVIGNASVQ
ncbi:MAG: hypothetical protein ACREA0_05555 [bacterium]